MRRGVIVIAAAGAVVLLTKCKQWTQQDTQVAVDVGTEILCAIEHAELSDPSLDALCAAKGLGPKVDPDAGEDEGPHLSQETKRVLLAHRAKLAAVRGASRPCSVTPTVGP